MTAPVPPPSRLRRAALAPLRPLIRFFDVRFQYLEARFPALEHRVEADLEAAAELHALTSRSLAEIERRLAAIEERLGSAGTEPTVRQRGEPAGRDR